MKKLFFAIAVIAAFASCSEKPTEKKEAQVATVKQEKVLTPEEEFNATINDLKKKFKRRGTNKDSLQAVFDNYLREQAKIHLGDSLGLAITQTLAQDFNRKQLDSVMNICEMYRNDPKLSALAEASIAAEATGVGKKYVNFKGEEIQTYQLGKKTRVLSLSNIIAQGKPTIVNFWSSNSVPSRDEMRKTVFENHAEFGKKVNFVSVAVWEDSITFANRALSELMPEWTCIYTGGKENSPTKDYGILDIPYSILIGPDGTIKARGFRGEGMKAAILKELGK